MKKLVVIASLFMATMVNAQSKFESGMIKGLGMMKDAKSPQELTDTEAFFERIADAEKTQWLPYYYAAYCTVLSTYLEKDKSKVDAIADKAQQLITKSEQIAGKENSETAVIESMIASAHMMVDPMSRYMQYGKTSSENIEKAKSLDPSNPRPVYLEGTTKFYTPEAFGGGKAPAEELFKKALLMFATFRPADDLSPTWGKSATDYFIAQCHK